MIVEYVNSEKTAGIASRRITIQSPIETMVRSLVFALGFGEAILAVKDLQLLDMTPAEFAAHFLHDGGENLVGHVLVSVAHQYATSEGINRVGNRAHRRVQLGTAAGDHLELERSALKDGFHTFAEFVHRRSPFYEEVETDDFAGLGNNKVRSGGNIRHLDRLVVADLDL